MYKLEDGNEIDIKIDSEYSKHITGNYGYEAVFSDDNERYFAVSKRIIDWSGKGELK